jgi:precorrin-6x reductase
MKPEFYAIKVLYDELSESNQRVLLKILAATSESATLIKQFHERHQKQFGCNVTFTVKPSEATHNPIITTVVHTKFGDFEGLGRNQKEAKMNAVIKAEEQRKINFSLSKKPSK